MRVLVGNWSCLIHCTCEGWASSSENPISANFTARRWSGSHSSSEPRRHLSKIGVSVDASQPLNELKMKLPA